MKKRVLHILNWNKYQARSDKELPWFKLWGRIFKAPWFQLLQDDEKFLTIALLDLARQFNNNIPEELVFKGYLKGNYGAFISQERIIKALQVLVSNDFLSDNCPTFVEVEGDKIRQDKTRQEAVGLLFEEFYSKYPRKACKENAKRSFLRLSPSDEVFKVIMGALSAQAKSEQWTKENGKFIPYPSTWLNGKRWEDSLAGPKTVESKPFPVKQYFG